MFALLKKESGDLQKSDGHVKINQTLMKHHPKCSELQTRELQMSELQTSELQMSELHMSAGYFLLAQWRHAGSVGRLFRRG